MQLELTADRGRRRTISPFRELGAYEALWQKTKASFKAIAEKFAQLPGAIPSDFVPEKDALRTVCTKLSERPGTMVSGTGGRIGGV